MSYRFNRDYEDVDRTLTFRFLSGDEYTVSFSLTANALNNWLISFSGIYEL